MRFAICDDEKAQQQLLQKYLEEWAQISGTPLKSELFASAEAFSFTWEEDRDFDLLILDIEMGQQNGMELAGQRTRRFPFSSSRDTKNIWPKATR